MINKKNIKLIILTSVILLIILYFVFLFFRIDNKSTVISDKEKEITKLKKKIKKEKTTQDELEKASEEFLNNAYFDTTEDFFENYVKKVFDKNKATINKYQSSFDEENNIAKINLDFNINAFNFFPLIKDIEYGNKLVVIKDLTIKRLEKPNFKVNMKLEGHYRD